MIGVISASCIRLFDRLSDLGVFWTASYFSCPRNGRQFIRRRRYRWIVPPQGYD